MTVKKGDRVICINSDFAGRLPNPATIKDIHLPEKGKIYTIRKVIQSHGYEDAVLLEEIHNTPFQGGIARKESPFALSRFRLCAPAE